MDAIEDHLRTGIKKGTNALKNWVKLGLRI